MNKKELVKRISDIASLDPKTARLALESILDIITETLADGEEIRIRGFGSMQRRKLHSRKYYHFATKEMRISREKPVVVFKPSSCLISQRKQIVDSGIHIKTISELGFVPQPDSVFNYDSWNGGETSEHEVEQRFITKPSKIEHLVSSEGNLIIPNKLNLGTRRQLKHEKEEQVFEYVGTVNETLNSYCELSYEEMNYPTLLIPRPGIKILNFYYCGFITGGVTEPILFHRLEKRLKAIEPEIDILRNVTLPIKNRDYGYKPDIALVWQKYNLYFDIEIDEPYDIVSRRPIHYIGGSDVLRNGYFLQNGWYVIRISEEQVVKQTENVVNYICKIIYCMTLDERFKLDYNDYSSERWTEESAKQMAKENIREEYLGIKRVNADASQQTIVEQGIDEYCSPEQFSFTRPDIEIIDCDIAKKNDINKIINNYKYIIIKRLYDGYEFISEKGYIQDVVENYHYGLKVYDLVEGISIFISYDNIDSYRGTNTIYKEFEVKNANQIIPQAIFCCNPITFLYHRSSDDESNKFRVIVSYPTYWYEDDFEKLKDEMTPKQLLGEALMWTLKNCETFDTTSYFSGYYHKSIRTYKIDRMTDLRVYDCFKPASTYNINDVWAVLNKGYGLTAEIMMGNFPNVKKKTLLYLGNLCNAYVMLDKIDLAMQIYLSYDKDTYVPELLNSWRDACMGDIDHFISNDIHKNKFEIVKRMLQDNGW